MIDTDNQTRSDAAPGRTDDELAHFFEVSPDLMCIADHEANFIRINQAWTRTLGYSADELMQHKYLDFVHPDDLADTLRAMQELEGQRDQHRFVNRYRTRDGEYRYLEWHSRAAGRLVYAVARDVTEKRLIEEALRRTAVRDRLTGLYNRHYLESVVGIEMRHADADTRPLSLAVIDIDRFKQVNDTWGHPVGDDLLCALAQVLQDTVREADQIVRLGGEEFLVLMPQTSLAGAATAAEKIRQAIAGVDHPQFGGMTVSIGVAERLPLETFRAWYRRADQALYQAKREGRNCVVCAAADQDRGGDDGAGDD